MRDGLARARRLLDADPERQAAACLVGPDAKGAARMRRAMGALGAEASGADGMRLAARALLGLGLAAEARGPLERSLALEPRSAEAWALRGWLRLASGADRAAAREDFDRAQALGALPGWGRALRAVASCALGDFPAAEADLEAAEGAGAPALAAAVGALLDAQRGQTRRGLERLARPASGWVRGFRAMLRRDSGDFLGAAEDFGRALESERSPWLYSQRADALNRAGFYKKALADLRAMARLLPRAPEPHVQAANVYFDQAYYPEALAALDRALARAPRDPSLWARRARFLTVLCRWPQARRAAARAAALAPRDESLRAERVKILILCGALKEARRALAARPSGSPAAEYLGGLLACRLGEYARARASFERCAALAEGALEARARHFALVAEILADPPAQTAPPRAERLTLCGIGIRHPFQASVEAVLALARCDVLYNNIGDPQIAEFLALFPGEARAVTRVTGGTAARRAAKVLRSLGPGKTAAFVTRIHPFMYRRIAHDLVELCRLRGVGFRAFGAVSLTEVLRGLAACDAGERRGGNAAGLRVFDIAHAVRNPSQLRADVPAVVYCIAGEGERRALARLLRRLYPPGHRFLLLAGSGDREDEAAPAAAEELEVRLLSADGGALLYAPPRHGGRR